ARPRRDAPYKSDVRTRRWTGISEVPKAGAAGGEGRGRLIEGEPGRAGEGDLGGGEDEVRDARPVDEGELAGDPAAGVVPDEGVGVDAELGEEPLEGAGLSGRGIVVVRRAVRLPEADQVRRVAGKPSSKVQDDLVPGGPGQGEAVQEDQRGSASVLA